MTRNACQQIQNVVGKYGMRLMRWELRGWVPSSDDQWRRFAHEHGWRVALDVAVVTGEAAAVVSVQRRHRPEGLSSPRMRRRLVHVVVDAGRAGALKVPHAMVVPMVLLFVSHLDDAGQSKVGDSQRERDRVDQTIGGLNVPMHNPAAMNVTKRAYHLLNQDAHNIGGGSRSLRVMIRLHPHLEVDAAVFEHNV